DLAIHELIHPVLRVKRDKKGALIQVKERGDSATQRESARDADTTTESFMHIHLGALPEDVSTKQLEKDLLRVLRAVNFAVSDWHAILRRIETNLEIIGNAPS